MPEITSLLERTTPRQVEPLDLEDLARRGRNRRRRNRGALVGSAAALVLLAVAVVTVAGTSDKEPEVTPPAVEAGPEEEALTAPVGAWEALGSTPFPARSYGYGAELSDGRILVWGGFGLDVVEQARLEEEATGADVQPLWETDGAIFDPGTNTWERFPGAPVDGSGDLLLIWMADDRLAIASRRPDMTVQAGVYDVEQRTWFEAPLITLTAEEPSVHWDGETLVAVDLETTPMTLRWRPGEREWKPGSPPPLSARGRVGSGFDGDRLAIWGGFTEQPRTYHDDGAIYHVSTDSWTVIPAQPALRGRSANVIWFRGRLYVSPLAARGTEATAMLYDLASRTWADVPPPPEPRVWQSRLLEARGPRAGGTGGLAVAIMGSGVTTQTPVPEATPHWFFDTGDWEVAPFEDILEAGDRTIATSRTFSDPGPGPYSVQIRQGHDEWLDAAPAPFGNRRGAVVVATDEVVYVVGGAEHDPAARPGDIWRLDLYPDG